MLSTGSPPAQIKPLNFLLACHVNPFGHPTGVADPERFQLVAQYDPNPSNWLKSDWIDKYSGKHYRIRATGYHGGRTTARVKSYGDAIVEYEFHAESKCSDSEGTPSGKQTTGLLQRRHVRVGQIKYIGKESNSLEDVESGQEHSENVYTTYPDPRRDAWHTRILPALQKFPVPLVAKQSALPERTVREAMSGRGMPRQETQKKLITLAHKLGVI